MIQKLVDVPLQTSSAAPQRIAGLDPARIVAAAAVIWIHTPQSSSLQSSVAIGRMAVPFFLATSVLLVYRNLAGQPSQIGRSARCTLFEFVRNRSRRLLVPFAAWSLIYLGLKWTKKLMLPQQPNDFPGWEAIFVGTAYHLWFLPFMWAVSLATFFVGKQAVRWRPATGIVSALGAGFVLALLPCPYSLPRSDAFSFMWLALPGVCWAFALAICYVHFPHWFAPSADRTRHPNRAQSDQETDAALANRRRSVKEHVRGFADSVLPVPIVGWLMLLIGTSAVWHLGRNAIAEAAAGLGLLIVALRPMQATLPNWVGRLASLAYGIYLCHLMVLKVGEACTLRAGWLPSPGRDICLYCVALAGSTTIAFGLRRSRYTRWLVG